MDIFYSYLFLIFLFGMVSFLIHDQKVGLLSAVAVALLTVSFVLIRTLNFPDDADYLSTFDMVKASFLDSPEKFGLVFKAALMLFAFFDLENPNAIFLISVIPLLLAAIFLPSRLTPPHTVVLLFLLVVPFFIQIRQGLSLAFLVCAFLARGHAFRGLFFVLAAIAHYASIPFLLFLYVSTKLRNRSWLAATIVWLPLFLLAVVVHLTPEIYSPASAVFPSLGNHISQEGLYIGWVGFGSVFFTVFLLSALYSQERLSARFIETTGFSLVALSLSIAAPLLQRFSLPIIVYLVHIVFTTHPASRRWQFSLLSSSFIFAMYKVYTL